MKLLHFFLCFIALIYFAEALKKTKEMEDFERPSEPKIGPKGVPFGKSTSCTTFGKFARFNPYSILNIKWFVFYYWSEPRDPTIYQFRIPTSDEKRLLHRYLDGHLPESFNWSSTLVMKRDFLTSATTLLEERGDRGEYNEYMIHYNIPKGVPTRFRSLRMKQTGDNRYLAIVDCEDETAIVLSHLDKVPPKHKIQEEASRLGYVGRRGKSYLYQGHEWMPIPEQDEYEFWSTAFRRTKPLKEL